ncbi:unnamed protein product [Vicia faba]|uniref:Uncharacterized protein n=1 Tax=Vicia faba TaxID=3906 RepID=A0AAV1APK4_VICFA|nr:unnamed protein product [Vicia faba]
MEDAVSEFFGESSAEYRRNEYEDEVVMVEDDDEDEEERETFMEESESRFSDPSAELESELKHGHKLHPAARCFWRAAGNTRFTIKIVFVKFY